MMQQMQVTVPDGIGPGMAFMVDTPSGQMQVTCPPNASAGGQMLVNVPAAQPVMMVQAVSVGAEQGGVVMGTAIPEAPVGGVVAPVPMQMQTTNGHLQDGYYQVQSSCDGCHEGQVTFSPHKESLTIGPVKCWQCCSCPKETMVNRPPGSLTYEGGSQFKSITFTSSNTFRANAPGNTNTYKARGE